MEQLQLTNENIAAAAAAAEAFLREAGAASTDILRVKLAVEETLLKYREAFGSGAVFWQRCTKRMNRLRVEVSVPGMSLDIFSTGGEMDSEILRGILSGMGAAPAWQYKNGVNLVVYTPKKKKRFQMGPTLTAIALGALGGGLCRILPAGVRDFLSGQLIGPVFNTCMGFLSAVAGPMIFLSVLCGIYGMGDIVTLGRIGKRIILRFLSVPFLASAVVLALILPFFTVTSGRGSSLDISALLQMALDIIPDNFLTPFTEGNPMQIVFLGALIGLALLVLGNRADTAAAVAGQANAVIQLIMEGVGFFVPFFIFCSIFQMMVSGGIFMIARSYKWLFLMLLGDIVISAFYFILICVRKRVRPAVLFRKMFPVFLIGLTTGSSSAALSLNMECCEKELGIDKGIISFGIPLGQIVFMPGVAVLFLTAGLCMAEMHGVPVSAPLLAADLLISVVLSIAAPPITGGALTCYTILFLQLGIPSGAAALALALNVILEFAATAVNLFCLQAELIESSGSLGMLNLDRLRGQS